MADTQVRFDFPTAAAPTASTSSLMTTIGTTIRTTSRALMGVPIKLV